MCCGFLETTIIKSRGNKGVDFSSLFGLFAGGNQHKDAFPHLLCWSTVLWGTAIPGRCVEWAEQAPRLSALIVLNDYDIFFFVWFIGRWQATSRCITAIYCVFHYPTSSSSLFGTVSLITLIFDRFSFFLIQSSGGWQPTVLECKSELSTPYMRLWLNGRASVLQPEGRQFHPWSSPSACRSVLGQDAEPRIAPHRIKKRAAHRCTVWMYMWMGECKTVL